MHIRTIEIICPQCKNKFYDHILRSLGSVHYKIAKESGVLTSTRKCPDCQNLVDISNGKNYAYTKTVFNLKQSIKGLFRKILP